MRDIEIEIKEVKQELDKGVLHRHSFCAWYDPDTKMCRCKRMKITTVYAPHCNDYITAEQALRKVANEDREAARIKLMQIQFLFDIMAHLINAAMIVAEDADAELKAMWEEVENHSTAKERINAEYARNRKRLIDAYKKMKYYMQNIDSEYRNYIEHYLNRLFTEEDGTYNVKEWQQYSVSGGVMAALASEFCEVSLENLDNANAVFQFMGGLKRAGILSKGQTQKYLVKK